MTDKEHYDVVICGGGLAGLTLARQLKLQLPQVTVLVLDKLARPLPEAAFKVGESTVSFGAQYLGGVLNLRDYFKEKHLVKMEIRYFFGDPHKDFADRPEFGVSAFPTVDSYQIDRGILENDLREMNLQNGIDLAEGVSVQDIVLGRENDPHEVIYKDEATMATHTVKCRWVVDAMGRRRFLQKKLGLMKQMEKPKHSSAWFRLQGRIDVADLVPRTNSQWHDRVPNGDRYYSTNHLMGNGYWVWLIGLSSGCTSIGIVTNENFHPFTDYNSYERAMEWLSKNEPVLAERIKDCPPLDFMRLRDYSYTSYRVFSPDRWACVGESGVFSDPFYSPGTDIIGFSNSIITKLVGLDKMGTLTPEKVDEFNAFLLSYNDSFTHNIHLGYPFYGMDIVMGTKLLWDTVVGWGLSGPLMFNQYFLDSEVAAEVRKITGRFVPLSVRIQRLLQDWAMKTKRKNSFVFLDYMSVPFVHAVRIRNLCSGKSVQELVRDGIANMEVYDELAQAIFLLAVEDVYPDIYAGLPKNVPINPLGISLDPTAWERDGLFTPKMQKAASHDVRNQYRQLFTLREN